MPTLQVDLERARASTASLVDELRAVDAQRLKTNGATQKWFFTRGGVDWLESKLVAAAAEEDDGPGLALGDADGDGVPDGGGMSLAAPTGEQAALAAQMDKVYPRSVSNSRLGKWLHCSLA